MDLKAVLNKEQLEAATHVEGPLLVIAGAGSGKTRIVTYRIAHLISLGVPSSEILAVTFTNKAANEMRERIEALTHKQILATTFHSLGAKILREAITFLGYKPHFAIFDEDDSEKVVKECLAEKQIKDEKGLLKSVRNAISEAKNALALPEDPLMKELYEKYVEKLKQYNAVDFDDLLFLTVKLFEQEPVVLKSYQEKWTFILVDEYQDTNHAQYTLLQLLSAKHRNVFAVGDPDQSIYSWRGANIGNILQFEKDYPGAKVVQLEQNYRSTETILEGANALIENNQARYEKNLWSERGKGEKIGFYLADTDRDEVSFVLERLYEHHYRNNLPLSECVIFYRTHSQSRLFEDALLKEKIPYVIVGGISFYMRREVKDILAFLRIANEGADFLSFSRTLNIPKRGVGPSTLAKIKTHIQGDLIHGCREILQGRSILKLPPRQCEGIKEYIEVIEALRHLIHTQAPLDELMKTAISATRYEEYLKNDPETEQERKENLEELVTTAFEWEEENQGLGLTPFLEELFLKSASDPTHQQDPLRLMTLHNGKGLEFSVAFIVGMEEEVFPHVNSLGNAEALEEERRLCYVGMTRAKDFLYLSCAKSRHLWGMVRYMAPSRFLSEIPEDLLKKYHKETFAPYEIDEAPTTHQAGDTVYHKDFGKGVIQKVYQTSLGLTYDILFYEENEKRSLVAKYAKLGKL